MEVAQEGHYSIIPAVRKVVRASWRHGVLLKYFVTRSAGAYWTCKSGGREVEREINLNCN